MPGFIDLHTHADSNILRMVEAARAEGLDIAVDQYPYTAGSTGLANVFPTWARAGSLEDFQAWQDCSAAPGRLDQWVQRLKRVFNIDIEICDKCGGDVRIIASIERPCGDQKDSHSP